MNLSTADSLMAVIIFLLGIVYVLSPFMGKLRLLSADKSPESRRTDNLAIKKNDVLEALADFELDRKLQKISEADFQELYTETLEEGAQILKQMDKK